MGYPAKCISRHTGTTFSVDAFAILSVAIEGTSDAVADCDRLGKHGGLAKDEKFRRDAPWSCGISKSGSEANSFDI